MSLTWPAAVAPSADRIYLFCVGDDGQMYYKWKIDGQDWLPGHEDWQPLGGRFSGSPAAVARGSRRMDLFALGRDTGVYYKWWDGFEWQPGPLDWVLLGLDFQFGPTAVASGPDRLDVFCTGPGPEADPSLSMHRRTLRAGTWEPRWRQLGGQFVGVPAATSWGGTRIDVFGQGVDGVVHHKWWNGDEEGPSRFAWEPLGKQEFANPAAVSWAPGRLDLLSVQRGAGGTGTLTHKWWQPDEWRPEQDWEPLGGDVSSQAEVGGGRYYSLTAVSWAADRLDVFALDRVSGSVHHLAWNGAAWDPPIGTGFENLGGSYPYRTAVVSRGPNRVDIFGGSPDHVWHKWCDGDVKKWLPGQLDWDRLGRP
ncbi:Repeat of unknown function [Geodermatophilus siccatus]|uniref:PLL-like beta propeller domain-containing protein n=1 Tax=Geodermatophilus siccatus TaxID=1137991 RepID=A0A1G9RKU3_9ACTN|nr:hypothetical protein [Geodermatophilus siccatus]SDM23045.1 Repeat of unknown function [Geodermatophilus siccatus]